MTPSDIRIPPEDDLRALLVELAQWSRVGELNGDLHARIASALALDEERREDPDYSPAYQDEYQRLWHEASEERDRLRCLYRDALVRDLEATVALIDGGFIHKADFPKALRVRLRKALS